MNGLISERASGGSRRVSRGEAMRRAGPAEIEAALADGRARLLGLFDGFERALGPHGLRIALQTSVNLPLWELGHTGWFEEFWLSRNPQRRSGAVCDPFASRLPSVLPQADALYDSSTVAHATRWQLALPDPEATRAYLEAVRDRTLALLREGGGSDDDLYFFRLVLFHEDMHREAWHFMAQGLGIDLGPAAHRLAPRPVAAPETVALHVPGGLRRIGCDGPGFAFDNELSAHDVEVPAFAVDRAPVTWAAFLPFVEAGGYGDDALWTPAGRDWLRSTHAALPLHLRRGADGWERRQFGRWRLLDMAAPALQLTAHEADAWCRWAGRRLPTEFEWETAAMLASAGTEADNGFRWGEVWEWTSSPFAPYPGFAPHPYRDYSQPWFDGRRVLRGGSFATAPGMKHPRYRNFFPAQRNDVFAGFRSCAAA
ncbi:MAG: selenoneine synthase SenA [Janthinobacterium lividum]